MNFRFKRLSPDAMLPFYHTRGSAGVDVRAIRDADIKSGETCRVGLGFAVEIPEGFEIQVRPRSGLAAKHSITVLNAPGTIDSDFRGEIEVILINHGQHTYRISKGERVAQLVVAKVYRAEFIEVEELTETTRGAGGFGSTGRN